MKRLISVLLAVCVILSLLTGCKRPFAEPAPDETTSTVLIVQRTANSLPPMANNDEVRAAVRQSFLSGGQVVIIAADGAPYFVSSYDLDLSGISDSKKIKYANEATDVVAADACSVMPMTGEIDVIEALMLAARNIDPNADANKVFYLGSALSTDGVLSFSNAAHLNSDAEHVVNSLKEIHAIPQFPENTEVILAGVGDVCKPQDTLSYTARDSLLDIWKQVCIAGGADVRVITASPAPAEEHPEFPEVSLVPIAEDYVPDIPRGRLDSEQVSFEPGSCKLSNPDKVRDLLTPLANQMIHNRQTVLLGGSTASFGTSESCVDFGEDRARAIAKVLNDLGVPSEQIIIRGLGFEHPLHIPDLNPDGSLNEKYAQLNRCVFVYPIDSVEATLLLESCPA